MPHHQYVEHKYTRGIMLVLRLVWSFAYLWVMLQAANVVPTVNKAFFNIRHDIVHLCITAGTVIFLYLISRSYFYEYCVTNNKRHSSPYRLLMLIIPYMWLFLFKWIISVFITYWTLGFLIRDYKIDSRDVFLDIAKVLVFKILVLANFSSIIIRTWALLKILDEEDEEGIVNLANLGEHLNLFLRI
ncbi:uncharacterized protein DMAD_03261 [Drosophila madeirensis]|uniref:Uncharacterized protein n=1 Tax=Drosophila madeirensis TaxID=30013 RepID=A0AAU9G717_DROMD